MGTKSSKHSNRHVWTRSQLAKLGKIPDSALSRELGVCLSTVLSKRQKLGIPASRPLKTLRWTKSMIALLGTLPDKDLAWRFNMNVLSVYKKRLSLGIGCYARNSESWHKWTKQEISLLGKMPDADVALRIGIKKASVAWKRAKLSIPAFTQKRPKKLLDDWTRKETALLGKMTDAAAAAALDIAPSAVRLKRISLGIPPYGRR